LSPFFSRWYKIEVRQSNISNISVVNLVKTIKTRQKMNKIILIIAISFISNLMHAQDQDIRENLDKAKVSNGKFYAENGKLVLNIDIKRIEFFYKWRETADTSDLIGQITSWDAETLRGLYESYTGSFDQLAVASIDEIRKLRNQNYCLKVKEKK
jgi:hypothetical protein